MAEITLTDEERARLDRALDFGRPHGAIFLAVEEIIEARFEPIVALANDLAAWDLCDMSVPESVDVPDDYELGVNDSGSRLHAALATPTSSVAAGQGEVDAEVGLALGVEADPDYFGGDQ